MHSPLTLNKILLAFGVHTRCIRSVYILYSKICNLLPREYVRTVLATQINHHLLQDTPYWPHTKDGKYSVKTGYHTAVSDLNDPSNPSSSDLNANKVLWKVVWGARVIPKVKHFVWRLLTNSLPTRVNLFRRKMGSDNLCPICSCAPETALHLFTQCEWVKVVWFGSIFQWDVCQGSFHDIADWVEQKIKCLSGCPVDGDSKIGLFFYWQIWKNRNRKVSENKPIDPQNTIDVAGENLAMFLDATSPLFLSCLRMVQVPRIMRSGVPPYELPKTKFR